MTGIFTGMFFVITIYLLFVHQFYNVVASHQNIGNPSENPNRHQTRPRLGLVKGNGKGFSQFTVKLRPENNFLLDEDDIFDLYKRQTSSDDYGHLRFGKREESDDYGHMRFGRGGPN